MAESPEVPPLDEAELSAKLSQLQLNIAKCDGIVSSGDAGKLERHRDKLKALAKSAEEKKTEIEERKFADKQDIGEIAQWGEEVDQKIGEADQAIRRLNKCLKEAYINELAQEEELKLAFERKKYEQELEFKKQVLEAATQKQQVKLPKLTITKFNGTYETWLSFWGKFTAEVDKANLAPETKFAYLKSFLEPKVLVDIEGLPFSENGYERAKSMLEKEYGKTTEIVNAYISNIMNLPVVTGANPKKVQEFYKVLAYNVESLETLGKLDDVKGNVRSVLDKLKGIKGDLVRGQEGWQDWDFPHLVDAIKRWREINPAEVETPSSKKPNSGGSGRVYTTRGAKMCVYCEGDHSSVDCSKVVSAGERKRVLSEKRLCFNCTGAKHRAFQCKSKAGGCRKCGQAHHSSICQEGETKNVPVMSALSPESEIIYPIVVVKLNGIKCRALLDTGAGSSYATSTILSRVDSKPVEIKRKRIEMMLGSSVTNIEIHKVKLESVDGMYETSVNVSKVDKKVLLNQPNPRYSELIEEYPHLKGVKMSDTDKKDELPIHVVLGASEYAAIKTKTPARVGLPGQPVAEKTLLGWTILKPGQEVDLNMMLTQTLHCDYEQLCRLDVLGLADSAEGDQNVVYQEFKEQLTRSEEGWYETGLPWKANHPFLPNNEQGSLRRLDALHKKLARSNLTESYGQIIAEQQNEGIVESAPKQAKGTEFYIPHKPVVRPGAESTKVRIVYDASARAHKDAPSLNECLEIGPSLQTKLWKVLVRERMHPVAVTGDLQKAFLQVRIRESERDALRFHWREDEHSELRILRFTRALFGLGPSPFLLGGVIETHLKLWEQHNPVARELLRSMYVDDLIGGEVNIQRAIALKKDANHIFNDAGFTLHKWHSNVPQLESEESLTKCDNTYAKQQLGTAGGGETTLLGLSWNKSEDTVSVIIPEEKAVQTKRGILAKIAKIYDPLGLASPTTLIGKLVYREACEGKLSWDQSLPDNVSSVWKVWEDKLPSRITAPRSVVKYQEPIHSVHLHAFGDASGRGVAAAVYAVVVQDQGVSQGLLTAKARLAKKSLTTPRLELVSAHMAANLVCNVTEALEGFNVTGVTGWLDSSVALYWLSGQGRHRQFVENRVRKIQEKQITWRHVPSAENPADLGSRGGPVTGDLLWWEGPSWLAKPDEWPPNIVVKSSPESDKELREMKEILWLAHENNLMDSVLENFPLRKALRVSAWVARFVRNTRQVAHKVSGPLLPEEMEKQETLWIVRAQTQAIQHPNFKEEKERLGLKQREGVWICYGRIQGEYPIYLPDVAVLATRLVEDAHLRTLHGGIGLTMAKVRERFWIPRLRQLVRKVIKVCHGCKRFHALALQVPPPGLLPKDRTEGNAPFNVIGLDFTGAIKYRVQPRAQGKAYVALYSCSLTRAIHLELVPNMELKEFIVSFKRFIARRGKPSKVYSDNGSTFVAAAKWLNQVRREEKFNQFLFANKITWQFNLSRAPWWGGQFERLIGLVKAALHKTIGHGMLSWGELEEVLLDVETTLNNRPLGYMEDDVQLPTLTPNTMLFLKPDAVELPEKDPTNIGERGLRRRVRYLNKCKDEVWKRWYNEYLKSLRERHRIVHDTAPLELKEGEVVIVRSEERNRGRWPLGIVTELIRGRDGIVRGAKLRSGTGYIERAVQHLYPLELSCDWTTVESDLPNSEEVPNRPKRNAAVAARERIAEIARAEQELE